MFWQTHEVLSPPSENTSKTADMKIALFVPSWPPGSSPNGIVTYASYLIPALRRLGHEVFVIVRHKSADDRDPYTIDLRNFGLVPNIWNRVLFCISPEFASFRGVTTALASAIRELVKSRNLEIFEMEETFGWSVAITRLRLIPTVVRLHGPWFLNGRYSEPGTLNRRRISRERKGIQRADFVTAPSGEVLRAVKNHYNLDLAASRVIPNPVAAAIETKTWDLQTCFRDALLFVGRFDKRKGGDLVLRAFAELATRYPRLKLIFVGPDSGIKEYNGETSYFENFVQNNCAEFRTRIDFRGRLSHSEVMSLRTKCFATIIASQYEIMPYSVIEAMSFGCPLVATAVGGIPQLIENQRNGLLVPSQDLMAMVLACKNLIDDHGLAVRLGRTAWQDCRDLYAPDDIAEQTVNAYKEVIYRFKHREG
jgi:glycosyltransferase involved in cell wall biosynthesis